MVQNRLLLLLIHDCVLHEQSLKVISDLRDGVQFPYKGEVDSAMGAAVKAMGPKHVLIAVPLQITGQRY